MCYGKVYFSEDFISGKGIVSAYILENEVSIFPRIIIDESFFMAAKEIGSQYFHFQPIEEWRLFRQDIDGLKFLNYLHTLGPFSSPFLEAYMPGESREMISAIEKQMYDMSFYQCHKERIVENLLKNKENLRIVQKYHWCSNYHNEFCKEKGFTELLITSST